MDSELRAAGCDGKQRFVTRAQADRIQRRRSKHGDNRERGEVYHCRYCGHFHIGTAVAVRDRADMRRYQQRGEAARRRLGV